MADPPEYRDPLQTRPLLDTYGAQPPVTRVLTIDTTSRNPVQFNVRIQSEDAGEDLRAIYFLDYGTLHSSRLNGQKVLASTFENTTRAAPYPWVPAGVPVGCHFVTLVVAHENSFDTSNDERLIPAKAEYDASLLTWTVNAVNPLVDAPHPLEDCPSGVVAGGGP